MPSRRDFLRSSAQFTGAAFLAPSLQGLVARSRGIIPADRGAAPYRRAGVGEGGYGPLRRVGAELALPAGFTYTVVSTAGRPMTDGNPTPNSFDGMAHSRCRTGISG